MTAYYNEIDPYAAQWLRNLIAKNLIAPGDVDTRSIVEVKPDDIKKYIQCHFFAGIGGWSVAFRQALWSDDRPVFTGSCPCQPFSTAGKQKAHADERHLWPHWFRLIRECRPSVVFGEEVGSAIAFGWLDEVAHDLETEGYAVAAAVLPACSVGKPHKRERLWFVAESEGNRASGHGSIREQNGKKTCGRRSGNDSNESYGSVADSTKPRLPERRSGEMGESRTQQELERCGSMGNSLKPGLEGHAGNGENHRWQIENGSASTSDTEWIECPDGKARPVKSGIRLLAHGVSGRVGRLRAYGNAIVPQVAAEFIKAYGECLV